MQDSKAKILILFAGIIIILLSLFPCEYITGIHPYCGFATRFGYQFLHTSIFHAAMNVYMLLLAVFIGETNLRELTVAYIISIIYPVNSIYAITGISLPTIGASGICYTLIGMLSVKHNYGSRFNVFVILSLAVGFFIPKINWALHIYSYLAGILYSVIYSRWKGIGRKYGK